MASRKVGSVIAALKSALKMADFPKFKLYIFGSYARGDARQDSDLDICIVSDAFKREKGKYEKEAVFVAYHVDPRIHLVLTYPEKFQKDELSPLYSRIRREAKAA